MAMFRQSAFKWQCDRCSVFFAAGRGGVCPSCKRTLCNAHLYGSIFARLKSSFSSERAICPECAGSAAGSS